MDIKNWKTGLENYLPGLEKMLGNVLETETNAEITGTEEADNEQAVTMLQDGDLVVKVVEERFQTELLIAFRGDWIPVLSKALLDKEYHEVNEYTSDLVKEFAENLFGVIDSSFGEHNIELTLSDIEVLKPGHLKKALVLEEFLSAMISVSPDLVLEEKEVPEMMMTVIMSVPNPEKVDDLLEEWDGENPFLDGSLTETGVEFADKMVLERSNGVNKNGESGVKVEGQRVDFDEFDRSDMIETDREVRNIELLKDVEMNISVEIGRRQMSLGKILQLVKGSVIELEKLAGEPAEILVNGRKIAQGDIVVIEEHFGVRITKLLAGHEKIKEEY